MKEQYLVRMEIVVVDPHGALERLLREATALMHVQIEGEGAILSMSVAKIAQPEQKEPQKP